MTLSCASDNESFEVGMKAVKGIEIEVFVRLLKVLGVTEEELILDIKGILIMLKARFDGDGAEEAVTLVTIFA
jgi:hypothetical protein